MAPRAGIGMGAEHNAFVLVPDPVPGCLLVIATPLKGLAMTGVGMPRRQPSWAGILMQNARTSNAYPYDDTIPLVGAAIGRPPGRRLYNRGVTTSPSYGRLPTDSIYFHKRRSASVRSVKLFWIDVLAYRAQT